MLIYYISTHCSAPCWQKYDTLNFYKRACNGCATTQISFVNILFDLVQSG